MNCECEVPAPETSAQRATVRVALVLNAVMFVVGLVVGFLAESTGVLADALDMGTDAISYALALAAITRSAKFKSNAARWTGGVLLVLGAAIVADVIRRFAFGSEPAGGLMMAYSVVAFAVNAYVLVRLAKFRGEGVHLNATYICTRADVLANIAVFASGLIVALSGFRVVDLIVGLAIALYVLREAWEIFEQAREADAEVA